MYRYEYVNNFMKVVEHTGLFLCKVAYSRYDVSRFVDWSNNTTLCTCTHNVTNNVYNVLIQTEQPEQQRGIPMPEETESVNSVGGIITAPGAVDTNGIELSQLSQATAMQLSGSHSLHVTDEDGNPIQFTMQDGRQLQVINTALYY
jgi:hypothetical protein